jgi:glycerol-3-phosphate dehydrogenase
MVPVITGTRFIRTYAGIRPLVLPEEKEDDRAISRGFALIDHEKRDGLRNLITVTGGKLITYRLMAEKTSDLLCQKMGIQTSCSTHRTPLSGKRKPFELKERLKEIRPALGKGAEIICDCEIVEREELEESLKEGDLKDLQDILHRTRLAKGTCQGGFCIYRLLGVLHDLKMSRGDSNNILKGFLEERWKGIRPILWGTTLKEEELIESIYKGIFNL